MNLELFASRFATLAAPTPASAHGTIGPTLK